MEFICPQCGGNRFRDRQLPNGKTVRVCISGDNSCSYGWHTVAYWQHQAEEATPAKAAIDYHSKPSPMIRSVMDAMVAAERKRTDLPYVVQVEARDWDLVILADYIRELEAKSNPKIAAIKDAVKVLDVQAQQIKDEVVQLIHERTNYQEMIGDGEPVAIVTEFGGIEYFQPLQEGTYLYIHHYTQQDIAKAEEYAKELSALLRTE